MDGKQDRNVHAGRCVSCRTGHLEKGTTTTTIERDDTVVVFKNVPAFVCRQCGEAYLDGKVVDRLQDEFEAAYEAGAIVDVRRWRGESQDEMEHA